MILAVFVLISMVSTCKLTARVFSSKPNPVWAQFTFSNLTRSQVYKFDELHKSYTVLIDGPNCNQRPTILTAYLKRPGPNTKPIGQTSAFLEGNGQLEYQVNFDGPPQMGMRIGVLCGFGDCGRG